LTGAEVPVQGGRGRGHTVPLRIGRANYYAIQRQRFVGSRQTFSNLLKEFEARGIISRRVVESRPPRVEYSLTEKGRRVAGILEELKAVLGA